MKWRGGRRRGPDRFQRVLDRLPLAEQAGGAAVVLLLERARLGLGVRPLHHGVQKVGVPRAEEIEEPGCRCRCGAAASAFSITLGVVKVGCGYPGEVLGELFVIEQLVPPGTPINLMPMLMIPASFMSGGAKGPRAGEADPGRVGALLCEHAAGQVGREAGSDFEHGAHRPVGLGVAGPQCRRVVGVRAAGERGHGADDGGGGLHLAGQDPLLGHPRCRSARLALMRAWANQTTGPLSTGSMAGPHPGVDPVFEDEQTEMASLIRWRTPIARPVQDPRLAK